MNDLKNKIALITGAKGGLGGFVTRAFLEAGATVAGLSRSIQQSDFDHPSFHAVQAEIANREDAARVVSEVVARHGRVDVLVHLVGGFTGGKPVAETDESTFQSMLDMNLGSAFHIIRAVLPPMSGQGSGRILAIGSRAAAYPVANAGAYSVAKAALVALIRTVALENKDSGITANIVLPGTMDTPANRKAMPAADPAKWVQPAQVAQLLVYLASEEASQVTGSVIPIYGAEL